MTGACKAARKLRRPAIYDWRAKASMRIGAICVANWCNSRYDQGRLPRALTICWRAVLVQLHLPLAFKFQRAYIDRKAILDHISQEQGRREDFANFSTR